MYMKLPNHHLRHLAAHALQPLYAHGYFFALFAQPAVALESPAQIHNFNMLELSYCRHDMQSICIHRSMVLECHYIGIFAILPYSD